MSKASGGLTQWFKEKWVDLSRPKKGGGYEPCGRDDASSGKYPKCVPASRAARMTPAQIESAIRRKRMAESRETRQDKKPIMVATVKKVGDLPGHPFRGNQWTKPAKFSGVISGLVPNTKISSEMFDVEVSQSTKVKGLTTYKIRNEAGGKVMEVLGEYTSPKNGVTYGIQSSPNTGDTFTYVKGKPTRIGQLTVFKNHRGENQHEIFEAQVVNSHLRQGVARAMLEVATQSLGGTIHHSDALSEQGRAWAESVSKSKNVPSNMKLYNKVKAEAKAKFDVYPSAYANGWLVQEYKRRGGKYKIAKVGDKVGHPFRGNQHTKVAAHVKSVVSQLKAKHGEELANKMKPIVESALKVWHSEGDLKAPLVVGGKKRQYPNGQDMTAQSVMDTLANEIGMKGLFGREFSAGDFTSGEAFGKGDFVGHPFRGNQWTRINSAIKAQSTKIGAEGVEMQLAPPVGKLQERHGIQKDWHDTTAVEPAKRKKVADAYDRMKMVDDSPEVKRSWDAAEQEIRQQFETLKASGVKVEFVTSDPYKNFHDMHEQFLRTGTLKVLKTESTGGHPYWSNEVNDMFRAVHDAYGHLGTGRGFDRHGEEAAYQAHKSMFSPEAHPALATELRGQNQFLLDRGYFGEQKLGFLPADLQKKYQQLLEKAVVTLDRKITSDDDNNYALGRSHHVSGGRHFASAKQISKENPTSSDVHVDSVMGAVKVINPQKKRRDLKKKKMAMEVALQKADKPLKDPKGGLTAAGRAKFNRETGSNLKPGVRGKADTPEKMRRKGSFLTRFFTNPSGPMVKPNGEPTRLALSANAWGEPVPKNMEDAKKLAQKGRNLLERYEKTKVKKVGDKVGHPFRGNQHTKGNINAQIQEAYRREGPGSPTALKLKAKLGKPKRTPAPKPSDTKTTAPKKPTRAELAQEAKTKAKNIKMRKKIDSEVNDLNENGTSEHKKAYRKGFEKKLPTRRLRPNSEDWDTASGPTTKQFYDAHQSGMREARKAGYQKPSQPEPFSPEARRARTKVRI